MAAFREVLSPSSGHFEKCARHTNSQTSRILQAIYVCDPCAKRLTRKAFNNRPPVFHGQRIAGYCGLCNKSRPAIMRQWFVCGPCWNIVLSYQKSIAASQAIRLWWRREITPRHMHLELKETEAVFLSPYVRGAKTKLQAAATLAILDFEVADTRANRRKVLFHIEQKTGPESIETMNSFQLDVNDYNDIAGAMNFTRIPAYIVHVFASRQYAFPTSRTVVQGMWWTDPYRLYKNLQTIRQRRGTDKRAMYFRPSAFKPIDSFANELEARGYAALSVKLNNRRVPLVKN